MNYSEDRIGGKTIKSKVKGTMYYPVGFVLEYIEGHFARSKSFTYYIPTQVGNKTSVTVVGDFQVLWLMKR